VTKGLGTKKLQILLGHAIIATTMAYVDTNFDQLKSEYEKLGTTKMIMDPQNKKRIHRKRQVMVVAFIKHRIVRCHREGLLQNITLGCLRNSILKITERLSLIDIITSTGYY
jgi:hypothetical protein